MRLFNTAQGLGHQANIPVTGEKIVAVIER
jgi:hypothetical protein